MAFESKNSLSADLEGWLDIGIHVGRGLNAHKLLRRSSGTTAIHSAEYRYDIGYVPHGPAVPVRSYVLNLDPESRVVACIQVACLPRQVRAETAKLARQLDAVLGAGPNATGYATDQYRQKIERLLLSRWPRSDAQFHRMYVQQPGLETVTKDNEGRYLGLHVDSWDGADASAELHTRRKLVLNLSTEPREFLFIGLSLKQIRLIMSSKGLLDPNLNGTRLAHHFMAHFPEVPVYRATIEPGHYYIAPTEFIVHDGSTKLATRASIQMTWRGYFGIRS